MEVLTAACEALEADPQVAEWLTKAIAAAERGTLAAVQVLPEKPVKKGKKGAKPAAQLPAGIVTLHVYSQPAMLPAIADQRAESIIPAGSSEEASEDAAGERADEAMPATSPIGAEADLDPPKDDGEGSH